MDDRIRRVSEMEARLNRITDWLKNGDGDVREDVRFLNEYYQSPLWRADFEADEAGFIPDDIPRGVLSEDAAYNALSEYDERMKCQSVLPFEERWMKLFQFDGKVIRVVDVDGRSFTGIADYFPAEYGLHEFNRDEASIKLGDYYLFESDIAEVKERMGFAIIRATEIWQQAGAYYVRIQAMAKKHHITLRQEFDEHDGPDTKYIVVTDHDFPIATARMYELDHERMMIGRVVVLPEYRHQGIGTMVVSECEVWAEELGYSKTVVESRENKVAFYEQMLYEVCGGVVDGETFRCVRMEKDL